jgi:fumarate reductase subunit C
MNTDAKDLETKREAKRRANMDKNRFYRYRIIDDQNCLIVVFLTMLLIFNFIFLATSIDSSTKFNITQTMKNELNLNANE